MRDRQQSRAGVPKAVRCAIYTRKSTEEGLEQEFNSLDAQREACAAYILSQRHEGWTLVPDFYDDGGFSGGNLDRPGLKALLAAVAAGKVDVIVVYKVDRLTRSLADFSKIVDVLEGADASFVSVTQAFNTTTSMGRLMLNVLLSFAQFEREVTGERIRDKVAASKKKGMWMGGPVPLGYQLDNRKLVIDEAEAGTVRHMFSRYLELGSGRQLVAELDAQGIRSKQRVNRHGRASGDQPISRGALYAILQNRLYVGEVGHKGESYPGQHDGIIAPALFERVQQRLGERRVERRLGTNADEPSLLAGLMWDEQGRRMSPSHANKQGRRYRYYVSQTDGEAGTAAPAWRVSAGDIEALVRNRLASAVQQRFHDVLAATHPDTDAVELLDANVRQAIEQLNQEHGTDTRKLLLGTVRRITLGATEVAITADLSPIDDLLATPEPITVTAAIGSVRSGRTVKLLIPPIQATQERPRNPALLKLVAQAFQARAAMERGEGMDEVAAELGYGREYLADMLRTSYLSPSIISAIVDGRQPAALTRKQLVQTNRIPLCWEEQEQAFGQPA